MKKMLLLLMMLVSLGLVGCNVEKKVVIKRSDPAVLFVNAQFLFKNKMPTAKIDVDVAGRKITVSDPHSLDYPSWIEMKFLKQNFDTLVDLNASDEDKQKLENLETLLLHALEVGQALDPAAPTPTVVDPAPAATTVVVPVAPAPVRVVTPVVVEPVRHPYYGRPRW